MLSNLLSSGWPTLASAIGNHLWQSTLCLVVAGSLTLVFRKNHARVRYGLWQAASIKFLAPFSLLIILGNNLAKPRVVYQTETGFISAMQEAGQPFARTVAHSPARVAFSATPPNLLPAILVAIWFCGFAAVVILWFVRWWRIRSIVRRATPLREGRELLALRRVERWAGVRKPIEFVSTQATLEPGIFGIFKPVLIWPQGISQHLNDAHLEAILAHEVWHVRRRDNLASAIHMLVEAIFWFHPMVWWMGSRLVEERERACDEEVLRLGSKPNIYAESILKTCEFCVESPLACVSGVTGADLKKRIVHIMTEHAAKQFGLGRKLRLIAIGLVAVTGPVIFGLMSSPHIGAQSPPITSAPLPSFEVASIKPNHSADLWARVEAPKGRFKATGMTVKDLIKWAYAGISIPLRDNQLSGGPSWISSERYDIEAKVNDADVEPLEKLPLEQRIVQIRLRVQSLLADRFKLQVRDVTRNLPVFVLAIAKNGPKLQEAIPGESYPNGIKGLDGHPGPGMFRMEGGQLTGQALPITSLVMLLSHQLDQTILDRTGLTGKYDFNLHWTPDQGQRQLFIGSDDVKQGPGNTPPPDSSGPSLFTALQEQLGLKLEATKGPVEVIVIDHIERPSEN